MAERMAEIEQCALAGLTLIARNNARLGAAAHGNRVLPARPAGEHVLPVRLQPADESTCASSVVGTCTKSSPRRVDAAAKPARSPITPPPSATTMSLRSI